ncbi:MAG TPA: FAD:protein FMN transferase [Clostridia bacterium]|nr:FAD:protein FMN transferase [Clostridia bacterium]
MKSGIGFERQASGWNWLRRHVWRSATIVALTLLVRPLSAANMPVITWQGQTMGSTYTVKLVDAALSEEQVNALKNEVDQRLKEVNRQMSHYQPDSELSGFNRAPAHIPFQVSPEFAQMVRQSLELNRRSEGAFDPTLGPVVNLWGFGEKTEIHSVPAESQLADAMKATGCKHLQVTSKDELVKDIPGLQINLSAIAKGFGVDEMARVLRSHGLTNLYVSISGEVFTQGYNPTGDKWRVGISAPVPDWRPGDPVAAVLSLSGLAVSTSGDYQKYFVDTKGHRLCHIFDPRTGWPVQHNLGSVTVVAETCGLADSLSTTLFVLGPEAGLRFIDSYPNAAALFIVRESDGRFKTVVSSRFTSLTGYKPPQ